MWIRRALMVCLSSFVTVAVAKADPFSQHVRSTEPLTAQQQRQTFHLPEGFEIQLVASEPDIAKPMNLAFDAKGRLWVTSSREYPFPAKEGEGRDAIIVLEDFDETGRARKITRFAEGLNIPIGLYPYRDGVIAFSIPHISYYEDTTGDGRADKVTHLFGPWGYERDTHGMASNFRRGFDGWLYGCHGFNNTSIVQGRDGHIVQLESGNTYRMRVDGERIEQFTWGQTNPFGMTFDSRGNLYTSDSHSKPIYQLLRGGYYEGIHKHHDGLGFAPSMMQHLHGSTAIAGLCLYEADNFPAEFRGNFFVGNVFTSRINRDSIQWRRSTPVAIEQPDFLHTDDPWFRPVNIVLGPDGALYVADFYNRIIGHYEVALDHPQRDRERGRIWRIVHREGKHQRPGDLTKADAHELVRMLAHSNFTVRMLAMDELTDRVGDDAIEPVRNLLADSSSSALQRAHGLWVLFRMGALDDNTLKRSAEDSDARVRVHAMRVLSEIPRWTQAHRDLALRRLNDSDPLVVRCAADAMGTHPAAEHVTPLLELLARTSHEDTHLRYVARMALRNQLRDEQIFAQVNGSELEPANARAIAGAAIAIESAQAGRFLARHLELIENRATLLNAIRHAARFADASDVDAIVATARLRFAEDVDLQLELLNSLRHGLARHGQQPPESVRAWGAALVEDVLGARESAQDWTALALDGSAPTAVPWGYEPRRLADTGEVIPFLSSLPGGEQLTGILRSRTFEVPKTLTFYVAGHNGFPGTNDPPKNLVRLRDAATQEVLAEIPAPRNDIAQRVQWDLSAHAGATGFLEIVDADTGSGYAWIAIARIEPAVVAMPQADPSMLPRRRQVAAEIAGALKLTSAAPALRALLDDAQIDLQTRSACARALVSIDPEATIPNIASMLLDDAVAIGLRQQLAEVLGGVNHSSARAALIDAFKTAPWQLQRTLALALSSSTSGTQALLDAIEAGKAPAQVLFEGPVRERVIAGITDAEARIKTLTQALAPPSDEVMQLIAQRAASFESAIASIERGAEVFATNCLPCHQIDGAGGVVGPQLNAIGGRGVERLLEDILDPNRNLDPAFRYTTFVMNDSRLVSGLVQREDEQRLVLIDTTGKEIELVKSDIRQRIQSKSSLMPGNFGELLGEQELHDLLGYLMSK